MINDDAPGAEWRRLLGKEEGGVDAMLERVCSLSSSPPAGDL